MTGDHHPPLLTVVLTGPITDPHHNPKPTSLSPPLTSPSSRDRRRSGRKSGGDRWLPKKIKTLTNIINPIPFVPKLLLNHHKHEHILKRLGLYNFSKVKLDRNIKTDLLVQLIVSYNSKKKCSYVNGKRIRVNKAELAKALELPVGLKDGGVNVNDVCCSYSGEEIGFIEDFVFNWVLLHEESWVMPVELVDGTRCVREGCPERLDAAGLVWYKVERELSQGVKLVDCYYASHLQMLIRVQYAEGFMDERVLKSGESGDLETKVEIVVDEHEHDEKEEEKVCIVREMDGGGEGGENVKADGGQEETIVDVGECGEVEVEKMEERVNQEIDLGERILKRCQSSDLESKVEIVVDEYGHVEKEEEKVCIVREDCVELNLGPNVEDVVNVREDGGENVKADRGHEEKEGQEEKVEVKVPMVQEGGIELNLGRDVEECEEAGKMEDSMNHSKNDLSEHDEKEEEKVSTVQEDRVALTLGLNAEEVVYVREDGEKAVDAEECEEVDKMEEHEKCKIDLGEQMLQHCESMDRNSYEKAKVEEVVDEQIEQVDGMHEQVIRKNDVGEHILQPCQSSDMNNNAETRVEKAVDEQIEQVEVKDGGRFVEGFDLEAKDDTMHRDGLNDQIPYGSHGVSAIDLFGSSDGSLISLGGPSFFNNSGKRVMELEEQTHRLDGNSKRLRTDETWGQEPNDFGSCMVLAQQWMQKAKMIENSTEEFYINNKYHQDAAMSELRNRHLGMEMIMRSKDEELKKTDDELFRLKRELYLMGDLVTGYRKALNDTRVKFSDYRKRVALQEKPLYKDAGSSGMVLSTQELEEKGGGKEH